MHHGRLPHTRAGCTCSGWAARKETAAAADSLQSTCVRHCIQAGPVEARQQREVQGTRRAGSRWGEAALVCRRRTQMAGHRPGRPGGRGRRSGRLRLRRLEQQRDAAPPRLYEQPPPPSYVASILCGSL